MCKALLVTLSLALVASAMADPALIYGGYPYSAALVAASPYSPYVPLPYAYSSAYQVQDWSSPLIASPYTAYPYGAYSAYYK